MRITFLYILLLFGSLSIAQNKFGTNIKFDTSGINKSNPIALQSLIDKAKPGDYIKLDKGFYTGPVSIRKNGITIDGQGKSILSGMGIASVVYIEADSVTIKNLVIQESGGSHDKIDCGVKIKGNFNFVENCRIRECLFGIDVFQSDNNKLFHNEISSLSRRSIALKGDAIRFWYSKYNVVGNNYWHGVRDMVVWYSSDNLFIQNKGIGNRYSIHFMYAHNNRIQGNEFYNNSVGVFLMYSEKTIMVGNLIQGSQGVSGMCLGMKETSSNQILNNRFIYSAQGIHFDVAPFVPEKMNTIEGNEIAFCGSGMFFHTNQEGNLIRRNYFHNNLSQVTAEGRTASKNIWEYNYFDDYQGFDRNKDNIGDTPYKLYTYVEHLWDFNKYVKFFYGAPILVVLDFLERLAPFS
ncbi:MAG: nitrous oxide reductase family maturation protein NosD, partial [Bacteroidales bacterium]|nr:nitrous oxide reductase family maturation protein NosD [Bacteroidales bacterium]